MTREEPPSSASSGATDQLLAAAINQHRIGQLAEAERIYRQILAGDPDHADSLHLLGVIAHQRGQHEIAVDLISQAIARGAPLPQHHYNLGLALAALGRAGEAAAQFARALALKGDYADAHISLGDALRDQGLLEQALESYRRGIALKPASAEAQNNIGAVLLTLGRSDEAIAWCERALAVKPDLVEAHTNLAKLHQGAGRAVQATGFAMRALDLRETIETKTLFVRCVRDTKASGDVGRLRGLIQRGLTEPWGRPDELTAVATSIVMLDDTLRTTVARAATQWPRQLPAQELLSPALLPALRDPLLHRLLEVAPIVDIALEQFLTGIRRAMLEMSISTSFPDRDDAALLPFFCALARQCFVNEYVFFHSADEASNARRLRDLLTGTLASGAPIPSLWPAAVAAYFPLSSLPAADALEARDWPDGVSALLTQQIREPREELRLRTSIPRLTNIDDDVSLKVREMYEENPYPRWIKVAPTESPKPLDVYLRARFAAPTLRKLNRKTSLDILIAGCGTGRQAVEMAQRFAGAKVLAIDLSLASLAYAKRKTQELGLDNIDYGQADILQVGQIGRSFDLIESSGVLHHLDDPWSGWRVLLSLLRPGGFMRVGLYSELGRPGVIAGRALVAERGYRADGEGIQRFRQELITGDFGPPLADLITKTHDFFTTSELRDLVFHVREHRMTIPQISGFLHENELEFLGFELDAQVARRYRARFPDDVAMTNLDHWNVFETENPDAFFFTYQFWIRSHA
jgi:SAM-dependent methyltransferase/Tfp pilus assembly protein PilF